MTVRAYLLLLAVALLPMHTCFGQPSASKGYADDLATIYGDIQQVNAWSEVCAEDFPTTAEVNKRAVEQWRTQYSPFVQEIEQRWVNWISDEARGDLKQKDAMLAYFQKLYDVTKRDFRRRLLLDGRGLFKQRCENYPHYLASQSMNLEVVHADRVKRLRQWFK